MNNSTASRTLGMAVMALITMAGLVAAIQIPLLGAFVLSLAGIPAFVILLAWGVLWFLGYSALTLTLAGILSSPATAMTLVPLILMPAVLLAAAVRIGLDPLRAITLTLLSATLFSTGLWGVTNGFGSDSQSLVPVREEFANQMALVEERLKKIEEKGGESAEAIEAARENLKQVYDYTLLLVPATFLFVWHLITLAVFYGAALKYAGQMGLAVVPLPPFSQWRFDWNLIWLFISGWLLYHVLGTAENVTIGSLALNIGANCLAISSIIYFVAGLSLLFFMFDKYKIGAVARVGLSCLALVFTQAVVWFGIIDVWADFRTPKPALFSSGDSDEDF
ncbi:MAG: hypothetical protein CVV42_03145 [Candidatus Riflebacteria bacterium HGW-Riflebacteria-2]|jgi:hypothetical protein|nr:MAG: hypothetical protein CVV42_03145 [Candidatus Riflebacteria bacterium HGW-Riflebacteria-2]